MSSRLEKPPLIRVLVVDDEQAVLELTKFFLEKDGQMLADTATSAKQALSMMTADKYDALVVDYQMPEMDGIELLKILRNQKDDVPFILFTGRGREDVAIEALNSGADYYLQKGTDQKSMFAELTNMILSSVSKRKAELELHDSERRLAILLDSIPAYATLWDKEARCIAANRRFVDLLDIPLKDILGKTPHELFPKDLADKYYSDDRRVLDAGESLYTEEETVRAKKRIMVGTRKEPLKSEEGRIEGVVCLAFDLTEQKEAQEKLVESERRYRTVFENTGAGTLVIEEDMSVSMVNTEFSKMSGYSVGEILGRKFTDFVQREEIPRLASYHRQRRRAESLVPKSYDVKLLTKAGQEKTLHTRVSMIPGTSRSVASFVDITDRIQAEKSARDSERFMDSVFSSIQDGISILDKDLRIVKVNSTMERWYAHSMPLVGKLCHDAYHGKSEPCAVCPTQQTLRTAKVAFEVVPKIGPRREQLGWLELFSYPMLDPVTGEMEGVIEYVRDVSERKHYEDALKQANEKLNLMGSVTRHDALNQLGVLTGWLSIAMESTQDKDILEFLRKSNAAADLIRDQLEFTADYQEMGVHGPVWVSVDTAFNRGVAGLRFGEVAVTLELSDVIVYSDPMIDKVFHNLAENSLRHGHKLSNIKVWHERSGEELKIFFSDDGQGVAKEEKTKIFSHGYGKHTGYGLYMARAILGITGMTIEEIGVPGEGAKFVITVPPQKFKIGKSG